LPFILHAVRVVAIAVALRMTVFLLSFGGTAMARRFQIGLLAVLALGIGGLPSVSAQEKKREWKPDHTYNITPAAGPWAICVMSYSGEMAFPLSELFVTELRRDYKLPAYFFNRSEVDRKKEEERLEANTKKRWALYGDLAKQMGLDDPKKVAPEKVWVKRMKVDDQFAVMIGGYRDMESARRSLNYIRGLKAPSDILMNKAFVVGPASGGAEVKSAFVNPFQSAFVVPNPTAPKAKPPEPDEREQAASLKELNAGETFSLLNCPGVWTLVVKVYRAPTIVLSKGQDKGLFDKSSGKGSNYLEASARQAHQLAEVLRSNQLGFESYVLHTNNMSMVTVGSFSGPTDPAMEKLANRLATLKLDPFESLMKPPMPFKVPK